MLNRNVGSTTGLLGVAAVVAAVAFAGLTCHKAPSGWEKTDESTIRLNLAAVDSAGAAYNVQLAAGRRDLAVQQAVAILLGHAGTDTVMIAPDSTVWVYFQNDMVTGLGELAWGSDTAVSTLRAPRGERVKAASDEPGGNLFPSATFLVPFSEELPGTEREAYAIAGRLDQLPGWSSSRIYLDSSVTVEAVRGLVGGESPVLFWAGHGVLVPERELDILLSSGLLTGKPFSGDEMARAAANEYKGYLFPDPGKRRQAADFLDGSTSKHHVVILPEFIAAYGNYDAWDVPANGNCTKTLVYLSCCYSGKWTDVRRSICDAFWYAGADIVCGWSWAVDDSFAADRDTMFFRLVCDTFMPNEAYRALGVVTDPKPVRGQNATLGMRRDSLVMVQPVLFAELYGVARRAEQVTADTSAVGASVTGKMMSATREELGKLTVSFPGPAAGSYDFASVDGAKAEWIDLLSGRTYVAQKDYQGVAGNVSVSDFAYNVIMAGFSGTLGWWYTGRDPKRDQPDDVVQLSAGRIKFTGKMGTDSVAPQETTYHHGYIDADETWSPSGNPHIIDGDVNVRNGAWLTIAPGCTVKTADYGLEVGYFGRGGIQAIGTASAPILFTSNNPSPTPGDWDGIAIQDSALTGTRFSYCTIEYAGSMQALTGAAVCIAHGNAAAEIDNCVIRLGGRYGVWVDSFSGLASFHDNTVTANGSYALCVGPQVAGVLDAGNTLTGNDSVGVLLAGPLKTSATWPSLGVPYIIKGVTVGDATNSPVLTIEPGTEIRFRKTGSLTAGNTGGTKPGRIVADGSAGRITFTSMATSPAPGDFSGVSVYEGSSTESEFRSCDFSYGGQGGGDHALLTIHKCNPAVTGCDFGYSAGYGMLFSTTQYPDTLAIKAVNTFHDNASGTIKWLMPFPGR
jgi:hypothetical protein